MVERRAGSRKKSFLQGRIYFNNRRSTVDCLVRDVSDTGARLKFSEAVTVPEVMELYIPNREEVRRAKVEWRNAHEMGVSFITEMPAVATEADAGELTSRVLRLESEITALKQMINELRAEERRLRGDAA